MDVNRGGDDMAERIVKVIQPTIAQINQSRKQRAAAYCRVSTDSEHQSNSFSAQLKYYSDYIKSNADSKAYYIKKENGTLKKEEIAIRLVAGCGK